MSLPHGYTQVVASDLPRDFVYQLAESVAQQIGYKPSQAEQLPALIKQRLGGRVIQKNYWSGTDHGSILIDGEANFTIFLPDDATAERDRFTIAHELGHYILHYLWPLKKLQKQLGPMCASRYGSDHAEWEANWFAAAFLMPAKPFAAKWNKVQGDKAAETASAFGVSRRAAEIRAKALGLSS